VIAAEEAEVPELDPVYDEPLDAPALPVVPVVPLTPTLLPDEF
jgi:hypothetical protein